MKKQTALDKLKTVAYENVEGLKTDGDKKEFYRSLTDAIRILEGY